MITYETAPLFLYSPIKLATYSLIYLYPVLTFSPQRPQIKEQKTLMWKKYNMVDVDHTPVKRF